MFTRRQFAAAALVSVCATGLSARAATAQSAAAATAASYHISYDRVADTRDGYFAGFTTPAINDHGTVAFLGYPSGDGAGVGIYTTKNGRNFRTIVTSDHPTLVSFGPPSINDMGLVAFQATHRWDGSSDSGVYAGYGPDSLATVATTEEDSPFIHFGSQVSVNEGGQVAFHAYRWEGAALTTGVYLGSGGAYPTAIATTASHPEFASFSDAPSLNDVGVVAFRGVRTFAEGSTQALMAGRLRWSGGSDLTVLFDNRAPTLLGGFGNAPHLTDGGTLAFGGVIKGRPAGLGVFTSPLDGTFATHATTREEPFGVLRDPAANDRGIVVFSAIKTAAAGGGSAIYAAVPGVEAPVCIAERGQPLFGSTVESVSFFRGLNERNQIAFQYRLANDAEGIAVARVHPRGGERD